MTNRTATLLAALLALAFPALAGREKPTDSAREQIQVEIELESRRGGGEGRSWRERREFSISSHGSALRLENSPLLMRVVRLEAEADRLHRKETELHQIERPADPGEAARYDRRQRIVELQHELLALQREEIVDTAKAELPEVIAQLREARLRFDAMPAPRDPRFRERMDHVREKFDAHIVAMENLASHETLTYEQLVAASKESWQAFEAERPNSEEARQREHTDRIESEIRALRGRLDQLEVELESIEEGPSRGMRVNPRGSWEPTPAPPPAPEGDRGRRPREN